MKEYLVVTDKSWGYVYADSFKRDVSARIATFFRNGKPCYTAEDVVSVVDTSKAISAKGE